MTDKQQQTLQKRALSNLKSYREEGYRSYLSYVKRSLSKYLITVILYIGGAVIFRDYQWITVQNVFWPVLQEILNWEKIDSLHHELSIAQDDRVE